MPSSVDTYPLLGKQLLACYWAPGETGQLSTGHYVATPRELTTMTWVLSGLPSHKAGHAQQPSAIAWKWDTLGKASPGGTSCLCRRLRCPGPCCHYLDGSSAPRASWELPVTSGYRNKKNPSLVYSWFCTTCRHCRAVDSGSTTTPLGGGPEGRVTERKPPRGWNLRHCTLTFTLPRKRVRGVGTDRCTDRCSRRG